MKVIAVVLLLVAGAYSAAVVQGTGPACPFEDPLLRPEGPLNVSVAPILEIFVGGSHGALEAVGLSTLTFEYQINIILLTASIDLTLSSFDFKSTYEVEGWIDVRPFTQSCLPSGNFTGAGPVTANARGVRLVADLVLFVNLIGNKVQVRTLTIQSVSFTSLAADLGPNYLVAGSPVDWAAWSAGFKTCFDREFAAEKTGITEKVRLGLNSIIGELTLEELVDLIETGGDRCDEP